MTSSEAADARTVQSSLVAAGIFWQRPAVQSLPAGAQRDGVQFSKLCHEKWKTLPSQRASGAEQKPTTQAASRTKVSSNSFFPSWRLSGNK